MNAGKRSAIRRVGNIQYMYPAKLTIRDAELGGGGRDCSESGFTHDPDRKAAT